MEWDILDLHSMSFMMIDQKSQLFLSRLWGLINEPCYSSVAARCHRCTFYLLWHRYEYGTFHDILACVLACLPRSGNKRLYLGQVFRNIERCLFFSHHCFQETCQGCE